MKGSGEHWGMPELPVSLGLTMLPSRDALMDVVQATANGSWSFADAGYDGNVVYELQAFAQRYPKWNILPIEECERLQLVNSSLWALLNVHSNSTTGEPILCLNHAPELDLSSKVKAIVLAVLFLFSLIGNLLTVYSISQKQKSSSRQYQSSMYNLIFHLSIADLLVTVTCLFGEAIWSYYVVWLADNFTCKLYKFLQVFSLYLSTFLLVLIGLDRFLAVKYPMRSLSTKRRCNRLIAAVWVLSIFLSSPQVRVSRWSVVSRCRHRAKWSIFTIQSKKTGGKRLEPNLERETFSPSFSLPLFKKWWQESQFELLVRYNLMQFPK